MIKFLLIGAVFLNGEFYTAIHHEYKTSTSCIAALKQNNLHDRGDGYFEGGREGIFVRAACVSSETYLPVRR